MGWTLVIALLSFFSNPASGRTSVNRGNIEKQVPRPSEEGHGARSGELFFFSNPPWGDV